MLREQPIAVAAALGLALVGCRDEEVEKQPLPASSQPQASPKSEQKAKKSQLEKAIAGIRRAKGDYEAPNAEQRERYVGWFEHLAQALEKGRLPSRKAPSGFIGAFVDDGQVWLLRESKTKKSGAGVLALRPGEANDLVLQAPHTFFDQGTLPLSLALFDELSARALMVNTVHRAGDSGTAAERAARVRKGEAHADLAHHEETYFQALHEAMVGAWKQAHFVQLHGFRDEQAPGVSVIVSAAGTKFDPSPVARALNAMLGAGSARLYPEEVKKLGGTTNMQARFNKSKDRGFLHLELSSTLRTRMEREPALRRKFADALGRALLLR